MGHVGVGGSCRGRVSHLGVGCSSQRCSRGGVGWVM